jgi:hypothetical protein
MTASGRLPLVAAAADHAAPIAAPVLRAAASDPDPSIRLLAQVGLGRLGDLAALEDRLAVEGDLAVFGVLAARAGRAPIAERATLVLGAQAAYPLAPAELRAGCAWAVVEHDPARGGWLVGTLAAEPEAAFWLASIVARRGGRLAALLRAQHARPELDRVADLLRW